MKAFFRRLCSLRSVFGAIVLALLWWLSPSEPGAVLAITGFEIALLAGGAAALGTGGGIASQLLLGGGDADFDLGDAVTSGFVPGSDPLLAQLQREQLLLQGGDPTQLAGQGAPVLKFLEAPLSGAIGPFRADFQAQVFHPVAQIISDQAAKGVAAGLSEEEIVQNISNAIPGFIGLENEFTNVAAVAAGFSNIQEMIGAQIRFEQAKPEEAERSRQQLETITAGRDARTQGISQILQDFPIPTQSAIDELAASFGADFRRDRLQQANVGGFPADLRNVEREGLQQALGLLSGQQNLAGGALASLRGDETQGIVNALAVQERGQAAQLAAAQLAGAQSQAFAGLANQTELANLAADQEQANQITEIFGTLAGGGFELLGAGKKKGPATPP